MKTFMVRRGPHQMHALIEVLFCRITVKPPFDFLTKTLYLPECKMTPFYFLGFFGNYLHVHVKLGEKLQGNSYCSDNQTAKKFSFIQLNSIIISL